MGQRNSLSPLDIKQANLLYNCKGKHIANFSLGTKYHRHRSSIHVTNIPAEKYRRNDLHHMKVCVPFKNVFMFSACHNDNTTIIILLSILQ